MKKTLAVAVTVAASVVLVACSSGAAPAPAPTVTVTQEVPAPAPTPTPVPKPVVPQNDDEGLLSFVRSQDAAFYGVDDYTILDVAGNICDSLSVGIPAEDLIGYAIESGLTSNQTAALFAGAIIYLCPENRSLVES